MSCMQADEIKGVSQKCKEKQDALEMKDKQVRILMFVTLILVFFAYLLIQYWLWYSGRMLVLKYCSKIHIFSALLSAVREIYLKTLQVLVYFFPSGTQSIFSSSKQSRNLLRIRQLLVRWL